MRQFASTVKLGNKQQLNKEQRGNSEPFSVTNMPVNLINSEQFCDVQKVPYYQVQLYYSHFLKNPKGS